MNRTGNQLDSSKDDNIGNKYEEEDIDEIFNNNDDFEESFIKECDSEEKYNVMNNCDIEILYNNDLSEYFYNIHQPELNDLESVVRKKASQDVEEELLNLNLDDLTQKELKEKIKEIGKKHIKRQQSILSSYGNEVITYLDNIIGDYTDKFNFENFESLDDESIENILYYIVRDFAEYERLTPLLNDPHIEDISCNGPEIPIFIYHDKYGDLMTNLIYEDTELNTVVSSLAQKSGNHVSIANPYLDGRLPDGSRLQLTYRKEISPKGSNFTIRKFREEPFTPVELVEFETFSLDQIVYLWLAIQNNKSLVFAGGTASGKTTSMNAISLFIPPRSKVISIEDTREITLQHENWIQSVTRDSFGEENSTNVDMYQLLRNALRQRPEYIIVGEIRGEEAKTLFQAMSTGHTTYSTMHAEDVKSAINRLENEPINLPRQMLDSLDILSIQVRTEVNGETVRKCNQLVEIINVNSNTNSIEIEKLYEFNKKENKIKKKGQSHILKDIQHELNYTDEEFEEEINRRKKVIKYLKNNSNTYDYREITNVLRTYMRNKDKVMKKIENDEYDLS